MAIDRLKFHTDDADSPEQAAAHIAIFLEWAAKKGFLAPRHDVEKIAADPITYVLEACPDLAESDLTDDGNDFAAEEYGEYLDYLGEHAEDADMSSYEYAASPAGRAFMLECLDEALEEFLEARDERQTRPRREP